MRTVLCGVYSSLTAREWLRAVHSQRRRLPRSTAKLSLAMEGILERRVLALEILDGLGSASRRLPLELENLQGAGCGVQGAGCRVPPSPCRMRPAR